MSTLRINNIQTIDGLTDVDVNHLMLRSDAMENIGEYQQGIEFKNYQQIITRNNNYWKVKINKLPFVTTGIWEQDKLNLELYGAWDQAESIITEMKNHYYGSIAYDPIERPDGTPVQDGDEFYNSSDKVRKVRVNGEWIEASIAALASSSGSSLVSYKLNAAGTVLRRLQDKLEEIINVDDFGADPSGNSDSTAALMAAAAALKNGQTLNFSSGTYLISYIGSPYASIFGNVVLEFVNKRNINIIGNNTVIKINNHNITANGGLRFMDFKGCKYVRISGFSFDMTFSGSNKNSNFYPFCGAITAIDDNTADPDFNTLNSDFTLENCIFKLYHPWGNWATSPAPYAGDPNNGYKLYSLFASGPYLSTDENKICKNIKVKNCTWLKGHNGYGLWFWAWMNCYVEGCIVEDWVTKHSNHLGQYIGGGVAFIRYIPFWAYGMNISKNQFRAKPTKERLNNFEGIAQFFVQANNMGSVNKTTGNTIITDNNIVIGSGYLSEMDQGIFHNEFGDTIISNNTFNGHYLDDNDSPNAFAVYFVPGAYGDDGSSSLTITGNTFGEWLRGNPIFFTNGSAQNASKRRCKSLVITNNIALSGDMFLRMTGYSYKTFEGCARTVITDNIIDGTKWVKFAPPSGNNYGIVYAANAPGDTGIIANNIFINKTEAIKTEAIYCAATTKLQRFGNNFHNISTPFTYNNIFPGDKLEIAHFQFPTTQIPSTDTRTLDDYEEGIFTPIIYGSNSDGIGTYTQQLGTFQKIGNRIFFNIRVVWNGHTGTGNLFIKNLPYTAKNNGIESPLTISFSGFNLSVNSQLFANIADGSKSIQFSICNTATGNLNLFPLPIKGAIHLSGIYEAHT